MYFAWCSCWTGDVYAFSSVHLSIERGCRLSIPISICGIENLCVCCCVLKVSQRAKASQHAAGSGLHQSAGEVFTQPPVVPFLRLTEYGTMWYKRSARFSIRPQHNRRQLSTAGVGDAFLLLLYSEEAERLLTTCQPPSRRPKHDAEWPTGGHERPYMQRKVTIQ